MNDRFHEDLSLVTSAATKKRHFLTVSIEKAFFFSSIPTRVLECFGQSHGT
jgi:hypothetical protein